MNEYQYLEKEKKSLLKTPSVTVPDGYNPYRDDLSVIKEIAADYPNALQGVAPLPSEDAFTHTLRLNAEWKFLRSESFKRLKKSALWMSLAILMYLGIYHTVGYLANIILSVLPSDPVIIDIFENVLIIAIYVLVFPAVIITANIGNKHKTYTFFQKPQVSKGFTCKWCVIALGIAYFISFVFQYIFSVLEAMGMYINDLSSPIPEHPLGLVLCFISLSIFAPILEEILFRGIFLTHNLKFGCLFSSIATGIFFGLIHQNHEQMFYAAVLGVIFAYMDIKAGSIIPSIIAHASINTFSFIVTLLLRFTNYNDTMIDPSLKLDGSPVAIMLLGLLDYVVYALILTSIILVIVEFTKNRSALNLPKGDSGLTASEKGFTFFLSPPIIVVTLLLIIFTITMSFLPLEQLLSYIM